MDRLFPLATLQRNIARYKEPKNLQFMGVNGEAFSFAITVVSSLLARNSIVIVPTQEDGELLRKNLQELKTLVPEFDRRIELFSSCESSPYETFTPPKQYIGDRMATLDAIHHGDESLLIIVPSMGLLRHTLPAERLNKWTRQLHVGDEITPDQIMDALIAMGYEREKSVEEAGQFTVRGGILDVFPCGAEYPVRLEFWGDEIESMRLFDPIDQRTFDPTATITLLPASELVLEPEEQDTLTSLMEQFDESKDIPTREAFLPDFYLAPVTLFDHLGAVDVLAFQWDEIRRELRDRLSGEIRIYKQKSAKNNVHPVESYYRDAKFIDRKSLRFEFDDMPGDSGPLDVQSSKTKEFAGRLSELIFSIEDELEKGTTIHLFLPTSGQLKRIKGLLKDAGIRVNPWFENPTKLEKHCVNLLPGNVLGGFQSKLENTMVITGREIYGSSWNYTRSRKKNLKKSRAVFRLSELKPGDYVVHQSYGVGMYQGIRSLTVQGRPHDYISIDYAKEEKLFIPCENINLIHKFIGMDEAPPTLNNLSGTTWKKARSKAKKSVETMAKELVELYAKRLESKGYAFPEDCELQNELESSFPFQETDDQVLAIAKVKKDMEDEKPMDQLVCGDVGFGKTEVAVRAAFKAICGGRQVGILVPTTILAMQHYNTFSSRFSTFPVRVEMLSRFRSKKDQLKTVEGVKDGTVDVVIGTHRLLQKDIKFKELGLLVVDEEQRFGVKHKEKLKTFREHIDVLTLTATPIPRTLYMSLSGARDMTVINTAPANRLPVKTIVGRYDELSVKNAIQREINRHGQVYYVHNRVASIDLIGQKIKKMVPDAKVRVAHGQMDEKQLERIMLDFYERRFDVLVSTTIIENGLDIPTVNTMIIERADTFGLSQLYQLRGRVGRSKQQAFAYFFYPEEEILTRVARKRLQTIKECSELGSGYKVAMRDLEIRGAGNLLGYRQHGQISQVGFEMYCQLLKEAVDGMQGKVSNDDLPVEIEIVLDASIPSEYVADNDQKIELYQRMASSMTEEILTELADEMVDRFGAIPKQVKTLLDVARLRITCRSASIINLKEEKNHLIARFHENADIDPLRVAQLANIYRQSVKFVDGENVLMYLTKDGYRGDNLLAHVMTVIKMLTGEISNYK